ncbi:hypothetical protein WN73_18595 [Bradyrhizobium sp. CCBAU 45394]|uniref:hypothetical protein n=1 Tax=Bradyrhizobium sp. CCBAU 45394 TaxID=1325087 RepID=UPI00230367C2|nr:hypothetical protein [Bradyrhizobium sp. CCBAU 45394]MDA9392542.1 hypothetical protein [Bradyrhizobium sp. CCBAU 45394]
MSKAIELIVAGYVKVKDRRALEELSSHRRKLLSDLQAVTGLDAAGAIQGIQDELAAIEAGLEQLKPPPGTIPENEWQ